LTAKIGDFQGLASPAEAALGAARLTSSHGFRKEPLSAHAFPPFIALWRKRRAQCPTLSYIEKQSSVWSTAVAFSHWRARCSLQAEAILASKV
jgi:hypothetical protein